MFSARLHFGRHLDISEHERFDQKTSFHWHVGSSLTNGTFSLCCHTHHHKATSNEALWSSTINFLYQTIVARQVPAALQSVQSWWLLDSGYGLGLGQSMHEENV